MFFIRKIVSMKSVELTRRPNTAMERFTRSGYSIQESDRHWNNILPVFIFHQPTSGYSQRAARDRRPVKSIQGKPLSYRQYILKLTAHCWHQLHTSVCWRIPWRETLKSIRVTVIACWSQCSVFQLSKWTSYYLVALMMQSNNQFIDPSGVFVTLLYYVNREV